MDTFNERVYNYVHQNERKQKTKQKEQYGVYKNGGTFKPF
jgi:hypothetical protein